MPDTLKSLPDFAQLVLVPVANPETAPILLELALSLAHPEHGRVIALMIALGDSEDAEKRIAVIEPVVNHLQEEGHPVEIMTEIAPSISRGILDAARETGADLLILGIKEAQQGKVALGTVVENVIAAAPCDVLVYRAAHDPRFNHIVVPMDGSLPASIACNMGVLLAKSYDTHIHTMHIQRNYRHKRENELLIRESLARIENKSRVHKTIITDSHPAADILREIADNDLLIVGFWQKTEFERWLGGDVSHELLNRAHGPVILISRQKRHTDFVGRIQEVVQRRFVRFVPTLTHIEQNELVWQSRKMAATTLDYVVMILLSAVLASLGLLLNSSAVIIGAMLVAPLMQPLEALSLGLITGQPPLIRRSVLTLFEGVVLALFVAILTGLLLPTATPTLEMLARGNPNLIDAGVALVSGLVAAYATARKGIPAALAGVAIAAALMPPLCTVGMGLAFRNIELAFGAALLFTTNIAFIVAAGCVVYFWMGMRQHQTTWLRMRAWWAAVVLLLVLVVAILLNLSQRALDEQLARERLADAFAPAELVDMDLRSEQPLHIIVTLRSESDVSPETVRAASEDLSADLDRPVELEVVFMRLVRATVAEPVCQSQKISFSQDTGCLNDGSFEFCIPVDDEGVLSAVREIAPNVECTQSRGRAQCDLESQLLCMVTTDGMCQTEPPETMNDIGWQTTCRLAALPFIQEIVATWYE